MFTRFVLSLILAAAAIGASPALAAPPPPCPSGAAATTNPQTVSGTIKCLDFERGNALVTLASGPSETTTILVTPGTLIQGNAMLAASNLRGHSNSLVTSGYRSMTDLRPGMPVQVYTTLTNGKLTATILILQRP
jgi:hypothetical protein